MTHIRQAFRRHFARVDSALSTKRILQSQTLSYHATFLSVLPLNMVSKRGEVEDGDAQRKRQKISDHSFRKVANHIRSLQDLRRLLLFEQDASPHTEQSTIFDTSQFFY